MQEREHELYVQFNAFRNELDIVNGEIKRLLIDRCNIIRNIAFVKMKLEDKSIYRPDREMRVIRELTDPEVCPEPLKELVAETFKVIMEQSRYLQASIMREEGVEPVCIGPEDMKDKEAESEEFTEVEDDEKESEEVEETEDTSSEE